MTPIFGSNMERAASPLKMSMILQKLDPYYSDNEPTVEEYGMANGYIPLANSKDLNHDDDRYYKYIGAKLIIDYISNNGGNLVTVIRRANDEYGAPIGQAHRNPMLETRKFEVELENGETDNIMAYQFLLTFITNWTMRVVRY